MNNYDDGYEMLIRVFVEAAEQRTKVLFKKLIALFEEDILRWDIEDYSSKFEGHHIISFLYPSVNH